LAFSGGGGPGRGGGGGGAGGGLGGGGGTATIWADFFGGLPPFGATGGRLDVSTDLGPRGQGGGHVGGRLRDGGPTVLRGGDGDSRGGGGPRGHRQQKKNRPWPEEQIGGGLAGAVQGLFKKNRGGGGRGVFRCRFVRGGARELRPARRGLFRKAGLGLWAQPGLGGSGKFWGPFSGGGRPLIRGCRELGGLASGAMGVGEWP